MISANELRIENLLTLKGEWYPIRSVRSVEYIPAERSLDNIFEVLPPLSEFRINGVSASQFEAIPLTEEWLLKFGFVPFSSGTNGELAYDIYELRGEELNVNINSSGEIKTSIGEDGYFKYEHCKYVHQLQNLYFALTGKELELKKTQTA
jgi:hypothetical protein